MWDHLSVLLCYMDVASAKQKIFAFDLSKVRYASNGLGEYRKRGGSIYRSLNIGISVACYPIISRQPQTRKN